ncbi:nitroreductase family protein [Acidisarcina polymorpha]|uniref:Nitroreductase family protein n=1 Tax=Acidisarcina polymorpha TaxID=2211140 RepID=A0A2Z5G751_9BACT|nr:nitroreductase family protein [Acidisarcina polymorpha]AXC14627.1 nitroreductase family protein [Acidisarcina polymorpha]
MSDRTSVNVTPEELEKTKHAPATEGIPELILKRWSPRAFADRLIPAEDLKRLFVAASWAASSYNEQPWRFFLGRRGDETYKKIFNSLVEFNQSWAKSAPVLVLSIGKKTFTQNGGPNAYALHDTGAATAYLSLQAAAEGLHTHSMAGYDKELARASFGIPSDFDMGAVTAIGYLGDPASLPSDLQKTELEPRKRKPVSEFVFADWEKPASF